MKINKRLVALSLSIFLLIVIAIFGGFYGVKAAVCTDEECAGAISLTVGNSNPTIPYVEAISAVTLSGGTTKTVYVTFNASDNNTYADLDHDTANVTLYKSGETNRTASACVAQENTTKQTVFNCSIIMQFYDSASSWTIYATVDDDAAASVTNSSVTFTVNSLDYVSQDIATITWTSVTVETDDEEADAEMVLTNGGNQDYTVLNITGYDATLSSDTIYAANFSVDGETTQTTGQVYMVNDTAVDATTATEITGLTTHGASVTEDIFFYVDVPAAIAPGAYTQVASWVIKVAA